MLILDHKDNSYNLFNQNFLTSNLGVRENNWHYELT